MALEINDSNFKQEVEDYKGLVMADFWAPWCGACQASAGAVQAVFEKLKDKVKVVKVNVDESHAVASRFGVMSIPTFIFFKEGKEVDRKIGLQSQEALQEIIEGLSKG